MINKLTIGIITILFLFSVGGCSKANSLYENIEPQPELNISELYTVRYISNDQTIIEFIVTSPDIDSDYYRIRGLIKASAERQKIEIDDNLKKENIEILPLTDTSTIKEVIEADNKAKSKFFEGKRNSN